jgi:sortase A
MSLVRGACLGLTVIGVACIGFALVGIAQPIDSVAGYPVAPSGPASSRSVAATSRTQAALAVLAHPKVGNKLGTLSIPKFGQKFPIVEGTDAHQLTRGVGHYRGSVMPGGKENCVLSGHRDTVFTKLGQLKKGDRLVVATAAGTFTYKVRSTRVVKANDKSVVVHADSAVLTVTTCYPFGYIGSAPKRFVVVADLASRK